MRDLQLPKRGKYKTYFLQLSMKHATEKQSKRK